MTLVELDAALTRIGKHYPPVPTFTGAFVGGIVATNAAGAATFKYGTTRDWVRALTVVLANGDVLDIERGNDAGARRRLLRDRAARTASRACRCRATAMPDVAKTSAGYFAAPGMDLIDLFIGSEGTLGVITDVTLRVLPERPAHVPGVRAVRRSRRGARVRDARCATRRARPGAPAIRAAWTSSAIEHMDARCLALLREDGADRANGVTIPDGLRRSRCWSRSKLPAAIDRRRRPSTRSAARASRMRPTRRSSASAARSTPPACSIASRSRCPATRARQRQLLALREAVPGRRQRARRPRQAAIDARIAKTAADMIVPFERLGELLAIYDEEFRAPRPRRRRLGTHLRRQPAPERHPAIDCRTSNRARRRFSRSAAR